MDPAAQGSCLMGGQAQKGLFYNLYLRAFTRGRDLHSSPAAAIYVQIAFITVWWVEFKTVQVKAQGAPLVAIPLMAPEGLIRSHSQVSFNMLSDWCWKCLFKGGHYNHQSGDQQLRQSPLNSVGCQSLNVIRMSGDWKVGGLFHLLGSKIPGIAHWGWCQLWPNNQPMYLWPVAQCFVLLGGFFVFCFGKKWSAGILIS